MRCRGHPLPGFQGARSPLGLAQRTKPSAEGRHFLLFELRSSVFHAPRRGPKSQRQKGNPGKPRMAVLLPNVISQDYPVVSEDYIARGQE